MTHDISDWETLAKYGMVFEILPRGVARSPRAQVRLRDKP